MHLGLPPWFKAELTIAIAHFARGDARLSVLFVIDPLVFLGLLLVSYFYFEKSRSRTRHL